MIVVLACSSLFVLRLGFYCVYHYTLLLSGRVVLYELCLATKAKVFRTLHGCPFLPNRGARPPHSCTGMRIRATARQSCYFRFPPAPKKSLIVLVHICNQRAFWWVRRRLAKG